MGKIHGHVINPAGAPQSGGIVSLSTDSGASSSYNFPVSASGEYSGEAAEGEYMVIYRAPDTPEGKAADFIQGVEITAGRDLLQNIDMTRQEYFDRLSPDQQKQIRDAKLANDVAKQADDEIAGSGQIAAPANADLKQANQDFDDIVNARDAAARALASSASPANVEAMAAEIRESKYAEIESLMSKATAAQPDDAGLWIYLGRAQLGLKDYLDAETSFKKALERASKADVAGAALLGAADAGLGEVYARTLMVDEANAAFAAAVKADPENATRYLRNQAIIFYQENNAAAQIDAADEALKADPDDALLYFIKAQGLAVSAPIDPDTNRIVLPPDCLAAFKKYLELAPNGQHAAEVKGVLQRASQDKGAGSTTSQQ
jgi:tetratricopeptide (TPR) repeat protein